MNPFQLSRNTTLLSDAVTEKAVELACERLRRDMEKTLTDIVKNRNRIILCKKDLKPEQYELEVTEQEITIYGADARSFIYALNYLSETYLGVLPFWFWNESEDGSEILCRDPLWDIPFGAGQNPVSWMVYQ